MGYIHEVEQGLRVLLTNVRPDDREAIVRYCKDKVLESYRNGQEAGKNSPADAPPVRTSRRDPVITTATVRVPRTARRRQ